MDPSRVHGAFDWPHNPTTEALSADQDGTCGTGWIDFVIGKCWDLSFRHLWWRQRLAPSLSTWHRTSQSSEPMRVSTHHLQLVTRCQSFSSQQSWAVERVANLATRFLMGVAGQCADDDAERHPDQQQAEPVRALLVAARSSR